MTEEEEAVMEILAEEEARTKRLEKLTRLKEAWKKKMGVRK